LVAIIPPGNYADQFPRAIPDSAAHLASQEIAKEINALNESIAKARSVVSSLIAKYSKFFTAHFGMQVQRQIVLTYFQQPVAQGAGTNAITEQIFQFTNPSITEYGGTRDVISAIVLGISQLQVLPAQAAQKLSTNLSTIEDAVFELDYRPDFEAMQALGAKSGTYLADKLNAYQNPFATYKGIGKTTYRKMHSDGYSINALTLFGFYDKAIATRTPAQFWEFLSRHRLVIVNRYGSAVEVHITEVDPATGALKSKYGAEVAKVLLNMQDTNSKQLYENSSILLAKVRKNLFPEMYLYNEGMTISADSRQDVYKKQLENAAMLWRGIPDKEAMPMAMVITEEFEAPQFTKTADKTTSVPVRTLSIYLQPPGTEAAMNRMLNAADPKKLMESELGRDFGSNVEDSDKDGYRYKFSQGSYQARNLSFYLKKLEYLCAYTLTMLSNPKLYVTGRAFLTEVYTNVFQIDRLDAASRDFYLQNLDFPAYGAQQYGHYKLANTRFNELKSAANWPMASPVLMFEAPFDDESDLKMLINMFKNYMLKEAGSHPDELKIPEPFSGIVKTFSDTTHIYVGISPGLALSSHKPPKSYGKYSYASPTSSGSTTKYQHYYINAKGLISGRQYGQSSVENLPIQIERRAEGTTARTTMSTSSSFTGLNNALMIGGSAATLAAIIGGVWYYNRNQSP